MGGSSRPTRNATANEPDSNSLQRSQRPHRRPGSPVQEEEPASADEHTTPPRTRSRIRRDSPPTSTKTATITKPRKLGRLGGAAAQVLEEATDSEATASPTPRKPTKKTDDNRAGTYAESPEGSPTPTPRKDQDAKTTGSQQPGPSPRKLGRLGGRPKTQDVASQATEETMSTRPENIADLDTATQGSQRAGKQESPSPEETAEQKANRKREELKRQLEEKAKHQAKKKRRF